MNLHNKISELSEQGKADPRLEKPQYNFKTLSRLACVQSVYLSKVTEDDLIACSNQILELYSTTEDLLEEIVHIKTKHFENLISEISSHFKEIEEFIASNLKQSYDNIHNMILSILIVAAGEIMYLNTKPKIVANEFTNIANSFLSHNEVGMVNSIIDNLGKSYLNNISNSIKTL